MLTFVGGQPSLMPFSSAPGQLEFLENLLQNYCIDLPPVPSCRFRYSNVDVKAFNNVELYQTTVACGLHPSAATSAERCFSRKFPRAKSHVMLWAFTYRRQTRGSGRLRLVRL